MIKRAPRGLGLKKPIIGWKKTIVWNSILERNDVILVMLQITGRHLIRAQEDGRRTKKRRTSEALVLAQFRLSNDSWWTRQVGDKYEGASYSMHDNRFKYQTGALVRPECEFESSNQACAPGIHYFANINDAIRY